MVAADRLPVITVTPYALRQDPCPGSDIETGVTELHPVFRPKNLCPSGIDLHKAVVVGTVDVFADCEWIHAAFMLGDAPEEVR